MKKIIYSFVFVIYFIFCNAFTSNVEAQDEKFQIGIQSGPFIPQNWQIQGYNQITYSNGSPVNAINGGFGNGFDMNLSVCYFFTGWGLNLNAGIRMLDKNLEMALAPNGEKVDYESNLNIVPITLSLINKFNIPDSRLVPYVGMGTGVLIATWEQKDFPENATRTWLKGSANPIDFLFKSGFIFPVYYDLLLTGEISYDYAATTWKIEDVDSGDQYEMRDLNIGGVSLKIGLAFRF